MEEREISAEERKIRDHIVMCNWTSKSDEIIKELHSGVIRDPRPIVVVTTQRGKVPESSEPHYQGVLVVPGDPADDRTLIRAGIEYANTAIVLADETQGEHADTKSILISLAIEAIQPRVHTIVELLNSKHRGHFDHTYVDEITCVDELSEKLIAQCAITHGISDVYLHLLTATDDTNEVYMVDVPRRFVGKTFRELEHFLIDYEEQDIIPVGLVTQEVMEKKGQILRNHGGKEIVGGFLTINPPGDNVHVDGKRKSRDYKLQEEDKIVVIAYEYPELEQL